MANTIILKKSSTASSVPAAGSLQPGEVAVNLADQKLYSKTTGGTVILVGFGDLASVIAPGTSGNVLTSNGTTWTSAPATGGSLTGWTSALATAAPNDTVYAASLTATGAATNIDAVIAPKGTGAIIADIPDSTATGGNKRGANAVDLGLLRSAASYVASGAKSVVIGGEDTTASAQNATAVGGAGNQATAIGATVVGGGTISGTVGTANTATGTGASVFGGLANTANGSLSSIVGGAYANTRSIVGYSASSASNAPAGTTSGMAQTGKILLARTTVDATATRLASNSSAAGTTNQLILPTYSAYYFSGKVIASVVAAAGATAAWTFEGVIRRGADTVAVLVGLVQNLVARDSGASTWVLSITADTTNGGLAVTVTGQAATSIRWVCSIETVEVTF